jgi:hypothetical protein
MIEQEPRAEGCGVQAQDEREPHAVAICGDADTRREES